VQRARPTRYVSVLVVFCISLVFFAVRGAGRAILSGTTVDFAAAYSSARCWIKGHNPYDPVQLRIEFIGSAKGPVQLAPDPKLQPPVYPPTAFPIIAVFAWLPWSEANLSWCIASILLFAGSVVSTLRLIDLPFTAKWAVAGLIVAYSPTHTGVAMGNPSVAAISLTGMAIVCVIKRRPALAGLLLGLAHCLKPQLSVSAIAILLTWRQWWPVLTSGVVALSAIAVSAFRAQTSQRYEQWLLSLRHTIEGSLSAGAINDPSSLNPHSHSLLNLQAVLAVFSSDAIVNNVLVWTVGALMIVVYLHRRRKSLDPSRCRDLCFWSALTILCIYHRYYDAQIFVLSMPSLMALWVARRRTMLAIGVCLLVLALPGQTAAATILGHPSLGKLGTLLLFRHQAIAVFVIALLAMLWDEAGERTVHPSQGAKF
jgi:hypothetical protein